MQKTIPCDVTELLEAFDRGELARLIDATPESVRKWRQHAAVPVHWWRQVAKAYFQKTGVDLSTDDMRRLHHPDVEP